MHKVSFDPVNEGGHDTVVWWLCYKLVSNKASLLSQHTKGTKNIIAYSLSRDFNISDQFLTNKFNSILPPHTAASFHIKLPPTEIIVWILSLAASSTQPRESPKPLQPSILVTGRDGAYSSHKKSSQTNSWTESHKDKIQSWCHNLQHQFKETSLAQHANPNSSTEPVSTSFRAHL